jgi:D-alanyl-D-alanine carboxypeptidase
MQLVIEEVTRRAFADVVRSSVLLPLSMTQSAFGEDAALDTARAVGYDHAGHAIPASTCTAQAAAGLWTNAADLGRFVAALLPGAHGEPVGRGVIAPGTVAQMLSAQPHSVNDVLFSGSEWGLGYALTRTLGAGELLVYHPGDNVPVWHGLIAALPARRAGVVVLTNGEGGRELRVDAFCLWLRSQHAGRIRECDGGIDVSNPSSRSTSHHRCESDRSTCSPTLSLGRW